MAYGLVNIPSIDFKPSTALGVKIPFAANNVFTSVYTSQEQTKYNIINFLLTDRGERPFNPNFGAGLRSRLFESITTSTLDEIKMSITSQIEAFFPNVLVTELSLVGDPDRSYITITLSYTLKNTNQTDSAVINIQNL
jgi:phage baseplate assembly protein W